MIIEPPSKVLFSLARIKLSACFHTAVNLGKHSVAYDMIKEILLLHWSGGKKLPQIIILATYAAQKRVFKWLNLKRSIVLGNGWVG